METLSSLVLIGLDSAKIWLSYVCPYTHTDALSRIMISTALMELEAVLAMLPTRVLTSRRRVTDHWLAASTTK